VTTILPILNDSSRSWNNVVCPGCACLCDDITLSIDSTGGVDFRPQCGLGKHWFESHLQPAQHTAEDATGAINFDDAIARAVEILNHADSPLVYGLSRSATPGQRAAIALGEQLGAVVDTTASLCHGPSIMALQDVGEVTSTLGEVRNRADLVIFWGCNPADSHPRHVERYSVTARGRFIPEGRNGRKVVMIGRSGQVETARLDDAGTVPDLQIIVPPGKDFELLRQLTQALRNPGINDLPEEQLQLMSLIRECNYGVIFFGLGLAETGAWGGTERTGTGHINVAALLHLVAELNTVKRFTARRMRLQGDVSGADNVLCWQTGYPFAVNFSRGYPRYNPGEFTTNEMLERGDVDAALLIGAETVPYFTDKARRYLDTIPKIVVDYPGAPGTVDADVRFTTAVYGLHAKGTAYRMDNVPMELKQLVESNLPTDEEVLTKMLARLRASTA
jgi:formylmethanofuran dehydrogenase subunit B